MIRFILDDVLLNINVWFWGVVFGVPLYIIYRIVKYVVTTPQRLAAEAAHAAWWASLTDEQRNHIELLNAIQHQTNVIAVGNVVAASQANTIRRQLNEQLRQDGYEGPWNF